MSIPSGAEPYDFSRHGDTAECHAEPPTCGCPETSTPHLVRQFADLRVWFAVNEVNGPTREGSIRHKRLGRVVDELRRRGVLD